MTTSLLNEWVDAHESIVTVAKDLIDPVSVVPLYGKDDRSIVARSNFELGTELVTLNAGAFLNGSYWLDQIDAKDQVKLKQHVDLLQLSGTMKTTMALLAELARGEQSDFNGYIQQLPTTISLPFSWSQEFRDMLRHTSVFPLLDDKVVLKMYSDYAEPLAKQFPTLWPSEVSTLGRFQWAYAVVVSRAFSVADALEPTLLPVIDMANHEAENPAAHLVKTDSGSFQLVALRKVEKGESVTIAYGNLSNAQLLHRYGFVLPSLVPSDAIHIISSELVNAFQTCSRSNEDDRDDRAEKDDVPQVDNDDVPVAGKGKGKALTNSAKRQKLVHPENDNDSLCFLLHGDAKREYGLGDALMSFVMASRLPAEQLYDALVVLLQEKDKWYSNVLAMSSDNAAPELDAIQLLCRNGRQLCRRILLGLMSLEEDSDLSDGED
uniref:SET domain-containing protein n=1 Tax=Peronospora matthiolae TaxID=2874970 RepID=A0AAV1V7Z6_9STRA